jgi:hypothetical protein
MNEQERLARLVRVRSRDFLARTGDRKSIVSLLHAIGDTDPEVSRYSLDAVFKNPFAYRELMDPTSLTRLQVIHHYSENDPTRAVRFSIESLVQDDPDLRLLALDVLDCNIAYLEPGLELHLKKLLHDNHERVRVKASRLLVLLSNYEAIDLSDGQAIAILEKALDSEDSFCRQMAYGMPASIFYKIKQVKSTIEDLQTRLKQREDAYGRVREELQQLRDQLNAQAQQHSTQNRLLETLEEANQLLQQQSERFHQELRQRDQELQQHREEKARVKAALMAERRSRAAEVEHARALYESLVSDFQQRETSFKHNVYDFYTKFQEIFKSLIQEKEELLDEFYRQTGTSYYSD